MAPPGRVWSRTGGGGGVRWGRCNKHHYWDNWQNWNMNYSLDNRSVSVLNFLNFRFFFWILGKTVLALRKFAEILRDEGAGLCNSF